MMTDLPAEVASPGWPAARKWKAEQFCRAWRECHAAVDRKYDPMAPENLVVFDSSVSSSAVIVLGDKAAPKRDLPLQLWLTRPGGKPWTSEINVPQKSVTNTRKRSPVLKQLL